MVDRILVAFDGEGGGVDERSWGQREIWQSMMDTGDSLSLGGVVEAVPGLTVETCVMMLSYLVSRHQSLRTTIVPGPDGHARQVVATSGEVPMEVVDADGADPEQVAEGVSERYRTVNFDYAHELPVRMAVVRDQGILTHVVAVYSHVAADVHGLDALLADLATMDPANPASAEPVTAAQPLDQVQQQRTSSVLRQSEAALRHAERVLRAVPARRFGDSDSPSDPRWQQVGYDSPATFLAVMAIAARNRVHTTPVLLAAFSVALCAITGTDTAVTQLVINNRFRPGFAGSVAPLAQSCLGVVEVADRTFDEVVAGAWRAMTKAGKHAYFDPYRMAELLATVDADRGEHVDTDCYFNDRRRIHLSPTIDRLPTEAEVRAALPRSTMRWERPMDFYDHTLFFHVNDEPDTFDYLMCADTHHLSAADMAAMVRRVESVVVGAAFDPNATTGISSLTLSPKVASVER
jgi:hypothetical protein